ncbi:MAG: hypothetical protein U1F41_02850 [Burkholderiales bacterium]
MALTRRVTIATASVLSAPGVLVAVAACLYIVWSLVTDAWYRDWFAGYGALMAALYVAFVAGVVALGSMAVHATRGRLGIAVALAGLAAAIALELELHDEAERVLPLGLLFGPYLAWGVAWLVLRTRPAPPAAPAVDWPDSRR